jgi:dihydroorotate dehydrogenase (NAD+) catalytic subunit
VYEIFESVRIPIVGVGGIASGRDALEYIMAGASAVQIGTGVWTDGPEVFGKVTREMLRFMEKNGYETVLDMVGVAHHGRT